jgi:hypothetical protein
MEILKEKYDESFIIDLLTNVEVSRGRTRRLDRLWMMFSFTSINMGFFMIRVFYSNMYQ